MKLSVLISSSLFISSSSVVAATLRASGVESPRDLAEDKEDMEIGGVIGESNPPKDFLKSPFLKTLTWTDEDQAEADALLKQIDDWIDDPTNAIGALLTGSLAAVCNQNLVPDIYTITTNPNYNPMQNVTTDRCAFWEPYLRKEIPLSQFFSDWLYFTPIPGPSETGTLSRPRFVRNPNSPGYYIEYYDFIANTIPGREVNFNNEEFADWMVKFLNIHGKYLQTSESVAPYKEKNPQGVTPADIWIDYVAEDPHPYNIDTYIVPEGGFPDYTQIFLRNLKAGLRPVGGPDNMCTIVSPCDCGIGMLSYGHVVGTRDPWSVPQSVTENAEGSQVAAIPSVFTIPGKLGDTFGIVESFPGYGHSFLGGPVMDLLLWFTDYHHFHSPVTGTVVYSSNFMGSHQYDFDNFNPNFPFGPKPASGSNQVEWYQDMDKHRRWSLVFDAGPAIGMVGYAPVGFWGVGSMQVYLEEGDVVHRGDYVGHFLYGGSSILMVFEPGKNFNWVNDKGQMIGNQQFPYQANVRETIGVVNFGQPCGDTESWYEGTRRRLDEKKKRK